MASVAASLFLAFGQLADPRVLRILLKSLMVTLLLFAAVALGGWYALDALLAWMGLGDALFAGAGGLRGVASFLLTLIGLWLAWRIIAMAVIQFYADEVVLAVETRHYPEAAHSARDLPVTEQLSTSVRAALRALGVNLLASPLALALLVTGVGAALVFWLVNAVLLGRELRDMAWLRHRRHRGEPAPTGQFERFLLGGAVSAMLAVPFLNLLAPIIGAAAATHLFHRREMPHGGQA
jgi:CysZ protein